MADVIEVRGAVPDGVAEEVWSLIVEQSFDLTELWSAIPHHTRLAMVSDLFHRGNVDDLGNLIEELATKFKSRPAAIRQMNPDSLAERVEKRGYARSRSVSFLLFWARDRELFEEFLTRVDATDEATEIVTISTGLGVDSGKIREAALTMLGGHDPQDVLIFLLLLGALEDVVRSHLGELFDELSGLQGGDVFEEAKRLAECEVVASINPEKIDDSLIHQIGTAYGALSTVEDAEIAAEDLRLRLAAVGEQLREMGAQVVEGAWPGAFEGVLSDLATATEDLSVVVHKAILRAIQSGGGNDLPTEWRTLADSPESWVDFNRVVQVWRGAADRESDAAKAFAVLEAVLRLAHKELDHYKPLEQAKLQAQEIAASLRAVSTVNSDAIAAELANGTHHLARLIQLARATADESIDKSVLPTEAASLAPVLGELAVSTVLGMVVEMPPAEGDIDLRDLDVGELPAEISAQHELPGVEPADGRDDAGAAEILSGPEIADPAPPTQVQDCSTVQNPGHEEVICDHVEGDAVERPDDEQVVEAKESVPVETERLTGEPESAVDEAQTPQEGGSETTVFTEDLRTLTRRALEAEGTHGARMAEYAVLGLIATDEYALAHHVTQWTQSVGGNDARIPSWLTHALALSSHVTSQFGQSSVLLRDAFAEFDGSRFYTGDDEWDQGLALLLTAASLRPSLMAPNTLAPHRLHEAAFKDGLPNLWSYTQSVAREMTGGQAFDPAILEWVKDQARWEEELNAVRCEAEAFLERAVRATLPYAAATNVWHALVRENQPIGLLFQPLLNGDATQLAFVRGEVARLNDPNEIRALVDRTDRFELGRTRGQTIMGSAYARLQGKIAEALELVTAWIVLMEARPGSDQTYRLDQAQRLRREAEVRHSKIRGELSAIEQSTTHPAVLAGVVAVRSAIQEVEDLYGDSPPPQRDVSPRRTVNGPLLRIPAIILDEDWAPDIEGPYALSVLEALAGEGLSSWEDSFEYRSGIGDHVGTGLLIEFVEVNDPIAEFDADRARAERARFVVEARAQVQYQAADVRKQVERAVMHGLLTEGERAELIAPVARVEEGVVTSLAFNRLREALESVSKRVDEARARQVAEVRKRMAAFATVDGGTAQSQVNAVLDQGDVLTANEYLHHLQRGLPLPPREERVSGPFDRFFPEGLRALEGWNTPNAAQITRMIRDRDEVPGLSLGDLSRAQAEVSSEALSNYFSLRGRRGRVDRDALQGLLEFLGFNVRGVQVNSGDSHSGKGRVWVDFTTEPVRDRERCPVSYYGSSAAGGFASSLARYRMLCVWNEPAPEDLLGVVGETAQVAPTFVLFFGPMGEDARRRLARLSRERRRTFLVIDEFLLLHLAGEPRSRMPAMYACTLPFTFLEPYVTTAGVVPAELFYGREAERESVMDAHGSCFIYGGRQLGKTALLRHVERRFHDPEAGRLALYMDLKGEGIGFDRPVDDVWPILADRFKKLGVLDPSVPVHLTSETLLGKVREWLDDDPHRRLLVLLDEADRFLEADSDFTRVAKLKGLMEQTGRRFKAVFAGLHNVQRMTRLSNNTLAHLGEPLCIGPLFERGEWKQARELVIQPLAALGYRFESSDLVTRILSQTNYYPSLLQLLGTQLLRHVGRPHVEIFETKSSPPYVLTRQHVEDAYQSQELWQRIRERFIWTLDLDPRYRLIALVIAREEAAGRGLASKGLPAREVRRRALEWWPQGFDDNRSEDAFRVLLEEMVGLGILREAGSSAYTLRSGNVALLIGSLDEIEESLLLLSEQDAPSGYEPQTFRRTLSLAAGRPGTRCSPLTAQQEADLKAPENGVSLICGSPAAGLKDLGRLLRTAFGEELFIPVEKPRNLKEFKAHLDELRDRRRDSVTMMLVSPTCPWTAEWVEEAMAKVGSLRSKTSFVRVAFVADPATVARIVQAGGGDLLASNEITRFTLQPWHSASVRAWLDELLKVPGQHLDTYMERLGQTTGRWPALLYEIEEFFDGTAAASWGPEFDRFADTWVPTSDALPKRHRLFGFESAPNVSVLQVLAEVTTASVADLAALTELSSQEVLAALQWADLLGIAHPAGNDAWTLDSIAERLLKSLEPDESILVESSGA